MNAVMKNRGFIVYTQDEEYWNYWRKLVYFGHRFYWKKLVYFGHWSYWSKLVCFALQDIWTKLSWTYWKKLVWRLKFPAFFSTSFQLWMEYCVTQIYLLKETGISPLHYWNKLVWFASRIIPVYFSSADTSKAVVAKQKRMAIFSQKTWSKGW